MALRLRGGEEYAALLKECHSLTQSQRKGAQGPLSGRGGESRSPVGYVGPGDQLPPIPCW